MDVGGRWTAAGGIPAAGGILAPAGILAAGRICLQQTLSATVCQCCSPHSTLLSPLMRSLHYTHTDTQVPQLYIPMHRGGTVCHCETLILFYRAPGPLQCPAANLPQAARLDTRATHTHTHRCHSLPLSQTFAVPCSTTHDGGRLHTASRHTHTHTSLGCVPLYSQQLTTHAYSPQSAIARDPRSTPLNYSRWWRTAHCQQTPCV